MKTETNDDIFNKISTQSDFARQEKSLLKTLSKMDGNTNINNLHIKLGWLYDQWAVISNPERKKFLQGYAKYYFKKVLRSQPEDMSALNGLGTVYLHENKYRMSLRYYTANHQIYKNSITYNSLGNVYRQLGEIALAKKAFETSLALSKTAVEKKAAKYNLSQL